MKYVYNIEEIANLEKLNREQKNITSLDQIKTVTKLIYNEFIKNFKLKRVLVLVGLGSNGLDGIYLASLLKANNYLVDIYLLEEKDTLVSLLKDLKLNKVTNISNNYDYIVDSLFGINYKHKDNKTLSDLIDRINQLNIYTISIDIPSGIDANNGLSSRRINADYTYIITGYKIGNLINDSRNYQGKIKIIDFGLDNIDTSKYLLEKEDFNSFIKSRNINSNKGNFKRCSIIAGSSNFPGASIIAYHALTSLRMGCGYSTLYIPSSLKNLYFLAHPEITYSYINDLNGNILYDEETLSLIAKNSKVITIGMGLNISEEVYKTIVYLLNNFSGTLIIDADGLNSLAMYGIDCLRTKHCSVVLTPHLMEFSRLIGIELKELRKNLFNKAFEFARNYDIYLVLKDSTTIITNGYKTYFNISGNPSLAKGGSGDLLAGIISGIISSTDYDILYSLAFSSFFLGYLADFLVKIYNEATILTSDLVNLIPYKLNDFKEKND